LNSASNPRPALLFDGECGLCNRVVRLLLRLDRRGALAFAPLQSAPAGEFLRAHGLPDHDFDTMVFVPDWLGRDRPGFLLRTDGVIAALRACGRTGRLLASVLALAPASLRDAAYRTVARWRYRVFGAWKPRPLPRPEWAARFIG
jgi:predicted DCC family thiol-disulfide oxidoreductase YuxK